MYLLLVVILCGTIPGGMFAELESDVAHFIFTDPTSNKSAILEGEMQFSLPYNASGSEHKFASFALETKAAVVDKDLSRIIDATSTLVLHDGHADVNVTFHFKKTNTDEITWTSVQLSYSTNNHTIFPDAVLGEVYSSEIKVDRSLAPKASSVYQCLSGFDDTASDGTAVTVRNLRIQPFSPQPHFSKERVDCPEDRTTTVPLTTVPPTIAPPSPSPRPSGATWQLRDHNGLCLELDATIKLDADYQIPMNQTRKASISVEKASINNTESTCNDGSSGDQILVLDFGKSQKLTYIFSHNVESTKNNTWSLHQVIFQANLADEEYFPNSTRKDIQEYKSAINGTDSLKVAAKDSEYWSCTPTVKYPLGQECSMTLVDAKIYPFLHNTTEGLKAHYCPQQNVTNDIVPIIVGAALAALVVIVLVAYLIGRVRTKRSTGYESV